MVIRPDAGLRPGGDVVQAEKTAEALRRTGVRVRLGSGEGMSDADVVHIFNLQTPAWTLAQVRAAQRLRKPIVLSPIYWSRHRLLLGAAAQFPRVLPHLLAAGTARTARGVHPRVTPLLPLGQRRDLRAIVNGCHLLLPNSSVEGDLLRAEFPELRKRMDAMPVVPNGVDVQAWERNKSQSRVVDELGVPDEYALCVARIEFRKNQLWLIRAAAQLRLPLVLVGDPVQSSFCLLSGVQGRPEARHLPRASATGDPLASLRSVQSPLSPELFRNPRSLQPRSRPCRNPTRHDRVRLDPGILRALGDVLRTDERPIDCARDRPDPGIRAPGRTPAGCPGTLRLDAGRRGDEPRVCPRS